MMPLVKYLQFYVLSLDKHITIYTIQQFDVKRKRQQFSSLCIQQVINCVEGLPHEPLRLGSRSRTTVRDFSPE